MLSFFPQKLHPWHSKAQKKLGGGVCAFVITTGVAASQSTTRSEGRRRRTSRSEVLHKKKLDFTMQHTNLYWNLTKIKINARKIDLYLYTSKELRSSEGLHI